MKYQEQLGNLTSESLLLGEQSRRHSGASLSGSVQVLEGDKGCLDTSDLIFLGVATGEREGNTGVVDGAAGVDVGGQSTKEGVTAGRASARDLDGLAVSANNSSVAVASAGGVTTSTEAEIGGEGSNVTTSGCCGSGSGSWGRSRSRSRSRASVKVRDGLLLGHESGRNGGASLSRSVQVLESDEGSVHASELVCLGGAKREGDRNAGVVGSVSSANIVVQFPDEIATIRWASAGNLDWLAVSTNNSSIAITGAGGVATSGEPEVGNQVGGNITTLRSRGSRGRSLGWGRGRSRCSVKVRDGLLLGNEGGRDCGAALSRPVQVLERDERSGHASELVPFGGAKREGNSNAGVVGSMTRTNVVIQFPDEIATVWGASAGNLDGLAISANNGSITIASAGGVTTSTEAKVGDQVLGDISLDWGSRDGCEDRRSYKDAEFHD
jgi:hypothetical protein